MIEFIYVNLFGVWCWIGVKLLGFSYLDIFAPEDGVVAITFSKCEEYIDEIYKNVYYERDISG